MAVDIHQINMFSNALIASARGTPLTVAPVGINLETGFLAACLMYCRTLD